MSLEWLYIIVLGFFGAVVYGILEDTTQNAISKYVKKSYNKIRFRKIKTYAKSQLDELQKMLQELNYEETESILKNIEIIEVNKIKNLGKNENFGILQFPKGISKEDVKETIVSQLSTISEYKEERNLLEPNFRKSFFDQLTYRLANKIQCNRITQNILDTILIEKRENEFHMFEEILKDREKFELFRQEARRRISQRKGNPIELQNIKEFSKFVKDISDGIYKIITICFGNVENYVTQSKSIIKTQYKGLYLLGRGSYVRMLNRVRNRLKWSVPELKFDFEDEYDWTFPETNNTVKAKMCVFKNKKVLKI